MHICSFTGLLLQEFKGYIFKVTGGVDKQGFPMKQVCGRIEWVIRSGLDVLGCVDKLACAFVAEPWRQGLQRARQTKW